MRLIVTAGAHGAFAFDGSWTHVPTLPVRVVSSAGAGDALLGGVLSGLAAGYRSGPQPTARRSRRDRSGAVDLGALVAAFTSPHTIRQISSAPYRSPERTATFGGAARPAGARGGMPGWAAPRPRATHGAAARCGRDGPLAHAGTHGQRVPPTATRRPPSSPGARHGVTRRREPTTPASLALAPRVRARDRNYRGRHNPSRAFPGTAAAGACS
jgi:hypothetical protein